MEGHPLHLVVVEVRGEGVAMPVCIEVRVVVVVAVVVLQYDRSETNSSL